ncbi:MAG: methylated-DNA--[protein]-cysteine S-methyltransferase [Burkholderiaceae bacterium]|nr:MAG: methylated-DNA--[protein]-cysteine S-methyltransferase [Burkholderiaceae bacterium]
MTPTLYYQLAPCALGQLLLAASPRGIAWLALGDQPQALCAELLAAYPDAALCSDGSLHDALTAIQQYLQEIPCGRTESYSQLAARLGSHPRAVARACASNRVALLVPCHRVLAADGGLAGYRWGLARKAALLASEADGCTME